MALADDDPIFNLFSLRSLLPGWKFIYVRSSNKDDAFKLSVNEGIVDVPDLLDKIATFGIKYWPQSHLDIDEESRQRLYAEAVRWTSVKKQGKVRELYSREDFTTGSGYGISTYTSGKGAYFGKEVPSLLCYHNDELQLVCPYETAKGRVSIFMFLTKLLDHLGRLPAY